MIDPEGLDLSPLDPQLDAQRWERMVSGIMSRATFELRRRAAAARVPTPLDSLVAWMRPALATAAVLALLSLLALFRAGERGYHPRMFFESADLPVPVTIWLEGGQAPTASDLLVTTGDL